MKHRDTNLALATIAIAALVAGSFLLSVYVALPDGDLTWSAIQNFSHFLLFAFLGWVVLFLICRLTGLRYRQAVVVTVAGLICLGLAIEIFQLTLAARDASVGDIIMDIAGITVGVLVYSMPALLRRGNKFPAVASAGVIAVTIAWAMKTAVPLLGFDLIRPAVPVIRSFNHPFSTSKIETNGGAHYTREDTEQNRCCVLRMVFEPALYSGIVFHERSARWSDYERLSIKIYSYLPDTRQILLRINDGLHNNLYADRYNGSFTILPGLNELNVPLSLIAMMGNAGSAGRKMNIDDVTRIQFFTSEIESPFALDLQSIELE